MRDFLSRMNITGFDADGYFRSTTNTSNLPNVGIAMSGGGYRAMLNGAGALAAFDSRTDNSTNTGHLGGLLQSANYLAGLSGGSWLVGSIYMNNFSTVVDLRDDTTGTIWEFENTVLEGPDQGGIQALDSAQYYGTLRDEVQGKEGSGFEVTITDYWGRGLSFQLINAARGGPGYTWSSIAQTDGFSSGGQPFPIVVADARSPGVTLVSDNTTVYEFNPFEFGTFDPTSFGFVPMQYLGTNFTAGNVPDNDQCATGFDNGGFVMGTSSSLFNTIAMTANLTALPSFVQDALNSALRAIGRGNEDIADYSPNPFFQYNEQDPSFNAKTLELVDGGEDLQNLPLQPLIQPTRNLDVIFAVDSSADTSNWPNATALVATYERQLNTTGIGNGTVFPSIPGQDTIVNLGLNTHPTFFGCDAANYSSNTQQFPPLLVYIPNSPYIAFTNISTTQLSYNSTQRNVVIENGYHVATMGNGTVDADWPACVGCAVLHRSFNKTNTAVPDICNRCFDRYCWNGTLAEAPGVPYQPALKMKEVSVRGAGVNLPVRVWAALGVGIATGLFVL
ncbi:MAG: hypothetical protein Q9160_008300 [Pyrenula sp. 1 TL-2023]